MATVLSLPFVSVEEYLIHTCVLALAYRVRNDKPPLAMEFEELFRKIDE